MKTIFRLLFLFIPLQIFAQVEDSTTGSWKLHLKFGYGFVIAHRPALEPLQEEHVKGIELALSRPTSGKNDWENLHNFPDYGITLGLFDMGSPSHLGKGFTVYPFVDFPLSKNTGKGIHLRYGMGLGYIEKTFNAKDNFKNAGIGSHINGVMHLDLHYEKLISEKSMIEIGTGITHFSNGSYSLPNLGINVATLSLAYHHTFGNKSAIDKRMISPVDKKIQIHFHTGGFMKKVYPPLGKNYFAATLSAMIFKPVTHKSAFGAGIDIFYDNSISARIDRLGEKQSKVVDNFRPGIYAAYHFSLNKLGIMFNMGHYFYNGWKDDGNIYHRICLNYYFEKLFICLNLKTHYARADMVELGIGYRIKKKISDR